MMFVARPDRPHSRPFFGNAPHAFLILVLGASTLFCNGAANAAGYSGTNPAPLSEAANALQVLDAQHFGPTVAGGITQPATASVAQPNVTACATDGCSVLLVRLKPYYFKDAITFTINNPSAPNLGSAESLGSIWASMPTLPAPADPAGGGFGKITVTVPAGQPTVVFYRPPSRYIMSKGGVTGPGTTQSNGAIEFSASAGGKVLATGIVKIEPPPVALAHGILADTKSMTLLGNFLKADGVAPLKFDVDWSGQNDSGFGVATQVAVTDVLNQVSAYRNQNIAVTRVDYVGHSMGGCLAILYAENVGLLKLQRPGPFFKSGQWDGQKFLYYRAQNFGQGDFRRVITIDSPLVGAPIATAISASLGSGAINAGNFKVAIAFDDAGGGGDYNCFYDLSPNSGSMKTIDNNAALDVQWLPIWCTAAPGENAHNLAPEVNQWLAAALSDAVLNGIDVLSDKYDASIGVTQNNSDMVVPASSQDPSTPASQTRSYFVQGVVHTQAESDASVEAIVVQALGGPDFAAPGVVNQGYGLFNGGFP